MESWDSDLSNDMYFVKIIKDLILKDLNTCGILATPTKGEEPSKTF